ncbi:PUB domain-containing protein [Mycena venus]|uniref:PUB domain-containing protein n=1 Tax=Mycena venus TaxID=2733690 RepID=A0A8H6Y3S4_9AGAR|nr:PUB domain-containing protein [Mycena venus]
MSSPSSPPSTSTIPAAQLAAERAAAAERRLQQRQGPSASELQFAQALSMTSARNSDAKLLTLLTIAENLLREPDNPKFQQFKPTNSLIKRELIDPRGTVEYARELGFYPEVKDFQPYYTFNPRKKDNLRIGAEIRLAFEDDRKMKLLHDELEKERRDARIAAAATTRCDTGSSIASGNFNRG